MSRGRKFLLGALFAVLLPVAIFKLVYPTYVWHQKMTVEVEADGQVHTASSVSEVRAEFGQQLLPNIPPLHLNFRGEAVVLEIPGRGSLFALLSGVSSGEYSKYIATTAFRDELPKRSSRGVFSTLSGLRQTREIASEHYPLLVTFADIDDPTTVKQVDPDNLAAAFGPGVSLKRITLEITNEPVTEGGVESALGLAFFKLWAKRRRDALERNGIGDPYFRTFASNLGRNDFVAD